MPYSWFGISFFFGDIVLFVIFGAAAAPVAVLPEPKGKQKKKGKKSGRTIQEEEDLDAILAELEGPSRSAPPAEAVVPASVSPAPIAAEELAPLEKSLAAGTVLPDGEEVTESAASKKKKKKKEKEKAAKAGAGNWRIQDHLVQGRNGFISCMRD